MQTENIDYDLRLTFNNGQARAEIPSPAGMTDKVVSLETVAHAFSGLPQTGLLPRNTLYYQKQGMGVRLAVLIPPHKHTIKTPDKTYQVPMPAFVFEGHVRTYRLFALRDTGWPQPGSRLYYPPLTNVFGSGKVCQGDLKLPAAGIDTIYEAWKMIAEDSYFTGHLIGGRSRSFDRDVRGLWARLDGKRKFPLKDLVHANRNLKGMMEDGNAQNW